MKAKVTQYKKIIFSALVLVAMSASPAALAESAKCSACQEARSIRDAIQKSLAEVAAAALVAGKVSSREMELDDDQDPAKCKPCQRTTRDELASSVVADPSKRMVQACCPFCEQPDSLGCQGENRDRCNVCQQGLIKISIAEAAAAALAAIAAVQQAQLLDEVPVDGSRAPREELADPCNPCGDITGGDSLDICRLNQQICALRQCCSFVNQHLDRQDREARKCCKKTHHKIEDVEELVESVIDQSTGCCSVIETRIGDLGATVIDIPSCDMSASIVDVINSTDVDMITWLKSLYVLLYQVYQCTCSPCD